MAARRWLLVPCILIAAACGRVEATRDFNHGLAFYDDANFPAAIRAFEAAAAAREDPAIAYNLALSHLAGLRAAEAPTGLDVERALRAVDAARALPEPSATRLAQLGYIEGSIRALSGDDEGARKAFEASLAAKRGFRPTLKALVELDPSHEDAPVARLALATAGVEPLGLEPRLSD